MSDYEFPGDPLLPSIQRSNRITEPAPPDDPLAMMRELRGALVEAIDRMIKLETCLMRQELATLAVEHKGNTALFSVDELRARMLRVETHLGLEAAE